MSVLTLELDQRALQTLKGLMTHYQVRTKAEIIIKALTVLQLASHVEKTDGQLFARKGDHETRIIVK